MRVRSVSTIAPVFPDDGPRGARIKRRVRGISIEIAALVIVTIALPIVLLAAAVVDVALLLTRRKPPTAVRLVTFGWWFLLGEVRALFIMLSLWIRSAGRDTARRRCGLYDLRISWARMHLKGIRVLFGLRFEVEGLEDAGPGPVVVMFRHASIIDNMLPDALIGHAHGVGLRFVIKRELQSLPVIDIGGRWVPTNFVRRASGDTEGEVSRLLGLSEDLVPGESILIYPEGTRHTAAKLARAKEKIAASQPEIAPMAEQLQNVLPPRLGGPLALLEKTAGTDVVFCGHHGFDGFASVGDIWSGGLVGKTISVCLWRVPATEIPAGREERIRWLYGHWQDLDDWVGAVRETTGASPAEPA